MPGESAFFAVVDKLYEAAWNAERWPVALQDFANLIGARGAYLLLAERRSGRVFLGVVAGLSEAINMEFLVRYAAQGEQVPRVLTMPARRPAQHGDLYRESERRRSATYNQFLHKYDGKEQVIVRLNGPPGVNIVLGSIRSRGEGSFTSGELELAVQLFPHFERAVALNRTLHEAALQRAVALNALDLAPLGVVLLAEDRSILSMNRRARAIVARSDGLIEFRCCLSAQRHSDAAALQRMIGSVIAAAIGADMPGGDSLVIERADGGPAYTVLVMPMPVRQTLFNARRPAAAVFVCDPDGGPQPTADIIAAMHNLTPAEALCAAALAAGQTVKEYSVAAGITDSTARWTLKQVLAKTDTHSQPDLVRIILSGLAVLVEADKRCGRER